jgi:hypothetical protein
MIPAPLLHQVHRAAAPPLHGGETFGLRRFRGPARGHNSAISRSAQTADIAVLRIEKGSFAFVDSWGTRMNGARKLIGELTVAFGRVVWDLNGITREPWDKFRKYQHQQVPAPKRAFVG